LGQVLLVLHYQDAHHRFSGQSYPSACPAAALL
jgi:hypothetical protein